MACRCIRSATGRSVLTTWIGDEQKMVVCYDPRDLSHIYLLGPDGTYYDLSYRDLRLPAISLWEQGLALRRLRDQGRSHVDEHAIFRTVDAMRRTPMRRSSKAKRRVVNESAVSASINGPVVSEPPSESATWRSPTTRSRPARGSTRYFPSRIGTSRELSASASVRTRVDRRQRGDADSSDSGRSLDGLRMSTNHLGRP